MKVTVAPFVIALRPKQVGDARNGFYIAASDILDSSDLRHAETSDRRETRIKIIMNLLER